MAPPKIDDVGDVVGLQELIPLLEVGERTPHAWRGRGILPDPDYTSVNGMPAWNRDTILTWAARSGRLPAHLHSQVPGAVPRGGGARTKAELERAAATEATPPKRPTRRASKTEGKNPTTAKRTAAKKAPAKKAPAKRTAKR